MRTLEDIEKNSVDLKASRFAATIERDKFERLWNEMKGIAQKSHC